MRILVIEHHETIRAEVVRGLKQIGAVVDQAANGKDGLWYALKNQYDVIVTALMLPDVDGGEIIRRLRSSDSEARVLIVSSSADVNDRIRELNAGADDFVTKPFALEEIIARVQVLFRRRHGRTSPVIQVGNLKIDMTTRLVYRDDHLVDLTKREFSLLVFLALRPGRVVSRTDIWENVYEFNSNAQSNVIDVYIRYLRQKIERPDWPPLIHTRRGYGYYLGESGIE